MFSSEALIQLIINTSNQQMNLSVREHNMGLRSNSWFNAGRTSIESEEYMILRKSG